MEGRVQPRFLSEGLLRCLLGESVDVQTVLVARHGERLRLGFEAVRAQLAEVLKGGEVLARERAAANRFCHIERIKFGSRNTNRRG